MKELIKYIAQALVDNPEQVKVEEVEGRHTAILELKVAKEDMGKVTLFGKILCRICAIAERLFLEQSFYLEDSYRPLIDFP